MSMLLNPYRFVTGAVVSYTYNALSAGLSTSSTPSTSISIGTADATRVVVCVAHWIGSNDRTLSSATINGVAATVVNQFVIDNADDFRAPGVAIFAAAVPTGTTVTVGMSFSGSVTAKVATYSVYNLNSATAVDSASLGGDLDLNTDWTNNVDVQAGGFGISGLICQSNGTALIVTPSLTQSYFTGPVLAAGIWVYSGAYLPSGTVVNQAFTINTDQSGDSALAWVSASWR